MKKYFRLQVIHSTIATVIFFIPSLSAQKKEGVYPQWSLRTQPSSLIEIDAGIMLGVNYRWSETMSASIEPTWIFYNAVTRDDNGEHLFPSGIKFRADLQFHLPGRFLRMKAYIAPELHFKYTRTKRVERFGMSCQNGSCAYFQLAVYKELKRELGGYFKWGLVKSISRNDRWMLEFYGGFGLKHMKFRETGIPVGGSFIIVPDRFFPESVFMGDDRNSFFQPMLPGGFKLLFTLN